MIFKKSFFYHCFLFTAALVVLCNFIPLRSVKSQGLLDDGWTAPINLSHSGSTSAPQLIIDSTGIFHAIWIDKFNGYMYSESNDGKKWITPAAVIFPYTIKDAAPVLITSPKGTIDAFWRDSTNNLYFSNVVSGKFALGSAWIKIKALSDAVLDLDANVDSTGKIHLVYLKNVSSAAYPAGIYYIDSSDDGTSWSTPQLLYESQYFRSLSADQAHVQIAMSSDGSSPNIYIVWDDISVKNIFLIKSIDGGKSWIKPVLFKSPDTTLSNAFPFNINLNVNQKKLLVLWNSGEAGICDQYSQLSSDDGNSWGMVTPVYKSLSGSGCPTNTYLIPKDNSAVFFISKVNAQNYITAWNGTQWSNPQTVLSGFIDPETGNHVIFGSQHGIRTGNDIYFIGSDQGASGDVWVTSRNISSYNDWFSQPSIWRSPDVISNSLAETNSVKLVADNKGRFHSFWIQADPSTTGLIHKSIFYAFWNGQQWTQPVDIRSSSHGGDINSMDVTTDGQNLFLVWSEGTTSQVMFSRVDVDRAVTPTEWTPSVQLPSIRVGGSSPAVLVDHSGTVHVAYSIPIDENRGIYLVQLPNGGSKWSDPALIADAVQLGYDMVGSPQLAADSAGTLFADWLVYPAPGNSGSLSLVMRVSKDSGKTWSKPVDLVDDQVKWSDLSVNKNGVINLLWQAPDTLALTIWHQWSTNSGAAWGLSASLPNLKSVVGLPALAVDSTGRLYLVQTEQVTPGIFEIDYWIWDNNQWVNSGSLNIGNNNGVPPAFLGAAVSPSGELIVIFPGKAVNATSGKVFNTLLFTDKLIQIPSVTPTVTPVPTRTATSTPTAAPVVATLTIDPPTAAAPAATQIPGGSADPGTASSTSAALLPGIGLSLLFIVGFFSFRYFTRKK